jgi:hypothetical protein
MDSAPRGAVAFAVVVLLVIVVVTVLGAQEAPRILERASGTI